MYILTTLFSILSWFQSETLWMSSSAIGRKQPGLNPVCVWWMCYTECAPSCQVSSMVQCNRYGYTRGCLTLLFQINMGDTNYHPCTYFCVSDLFCSIFPEISAQSSAGYFVARAGLSWDRKMLKYKHDKGIETTQENAWNTEIITAFHMIL